MQARASVRETERPPRSWTFHWRQLPASMIAAVIQPYERISDSLSQIGLASTRISLAVGSVVAAGAYSAICYGIHSNMVRTFDMTVRKLAGTK